MQTAQLPLLDKILLAVTGVYTVGVGLVIAWLFQPSRCTDCNGTGQIAGKTCCGCAGHGMQNL